MDQILANIDGDSICYICSKDTLLESTNAVDTLMNTILEKTGSTHYYLFLSKGPYFRHKVNTDYKGKRKSSPLKYLKTLQAYLIEQYNAEVFPYVEADDMVSYVAHRAAAGHFNNFKATYTCSIDKDVKKQIPGLHFDYKKHELSKCEEYEATEFLHTQTLMGDSTDNITGIPGIGEKKAAEKLEGINPDLHPVAVFKAYCDHYKSPQVAVTEFYKNFTQIYILRNDEDFMNAVGYIPELLDPNQVITT